MLSVDKIINLFHLLVTKYHWYFAITVILIYTTTAYKSSGFHHPDEHFQIIEFAKYKLGETDANELAWEFDAAIRSAIQPTFCFLVFKALYSLNINDPYAMAFVLRLISVFLTAYAMYVYTQ